MSTKVIRLELSEKLWLNPKMEINTALHEPNWRRTALSSFEKKWFLNDIKVPSHSVFSFFILITSVRKKGWMRTTSVAVMITFFSKVSFLKWLTKAFKRQLMILRTWVNHRIKVRPSLSVRPFVQLLHFSIYT